LTQWRYHSTLLPNFVSKLGVGMSPDEVTTGLALQNLMPVALAAVAVMLIARAVAARDRTSAAVAAVGAAGVALAGISKAGWKLVVVVTGRDVGVLSDALFPLLAVGFTCLAWSLYRSARVAAGEPTPGEWIGPAVVLVPALGLAVALGATAGARPALMTLLGVATVANVTTTVLLVRRALAGGLPLAAALFMLNLALVFVLAYVARLPQNLALQWGEQLTNTASQAGFVLASWMLARRGLPVRSPERSPLPQAMAGRG
jgi:hypothetical protein